MNCLATAFARTFVAVSEHFCCFRMYHFKSNKMPHFNITVCAALQFSQSVTNQYICWNNGAIYRNNTGNKKNRIMNNFISIANRLRPKSSRRSIKMIYIVCIVNYVLEENKQD